MNENPIVWKNLQVIDHCVLLSESFHRVVKKSLMGSETDPEANAYSLYHCKSIIVSHGTEKDPVFNFANLKAQELWKLSWEEFVKMPSRLSAEPMQRSEREKLLKQANEKGFISNYTGIRISSKGERFLIKDTILWNVIDKEGNYRGQAAVFSDWEYVS